MAYYFTFLIYAPGQNNFAADFYLYENFNCFAACDSEAPPRFVADGGGITSGKRFQCYLTFVRYVRNLAIQTNYTGQQEKIICFI